MLNHKYTYILICLYQFLSANELNNFFISDSNKNHAKLIKNVFKNNKESLFLFLPHKENNFQFLVRARKNKKFRLKEENFLNFLDFVKPKRVIFLIENKEIFKNFLLDFNEKFGKKKLEIYYIDNQDEILDIWEISSILKNSSIAKDYLEEIN